MKQVLNTAIYHFFNIERPLEELKPELQEKCDSLGIRGTIILSPEGVNAFFSGTEEKVNALKQVLCEALDIKTPHFKDSWSEHVTFNRMKVRIRKKLVPMGDSSILPHETSAPSLEPEKLKAWIEEGKDFILLDTRNDYEVKIGTFKDAKDLNIKHFSHYEDETKKLPAEWKDKSIVMFCTGGIRCEKAAPYLLKAGFKNVLQLEGGILNYFEKVGGDYFEGDCFVFDKRVAVNSHLKEVDEIPCVNCGKMISRKNRGEDEDPYEFLCPACDEILTT